MIFFLVFTVGTWTAPGDKSQNIVEASSMTGYPWNFKLQTFPHWASSNLSPFLAWLFFLWSCLILSFYSGTLSLPVFINLSLQSWRHPFALCPPLPYGPRKSCWLFSLFSFIVLGRTEWQFPSSFQAEMKITILFLK